MITSEVINYPSYVFSSLGSVQESYTAFNFQVSILSFNLDSSWPFFALPNLDNFEEYMSLFYRMSTQQFKKLPLLIHVVNIRIVIPPPPHTHKE